MAIQVLMLLYRVILYLFRHIHLEKFCLIELLSIIGIS